MVRLAERGVAVPRLRGSERVGDGDRERRDLASACDEPPGEGPGWGLMENGELLELGPPRPRSTRIAGLPQGPP